MTRPQAPSSRDHSDDTLIVLAIGTAATAAGGHWLVGNLAALIGRGRPLRAGLGAAPAALTRLPSHAGDPRLAWDEPARSNLPGPVIYWLAVVLVLLLTLTIATVLTQRLGSHGDEPPDKRRRARRRDPGTPGHHSRSPPIAHARARARPVRAGAASCSPPRERRRMADVEREEPWRCSVRRSRARPPA